VRSGQRQTACGGALVSPPYYDDEGVLLDFKDRVEEAQEGCIPSQVILRAPSPHEGLVEKSSTSRWSPSTNAQEGVLPGLRILEALPGSRRGHRYYWIPYSHYAYYHHEDSDHHRGGHHHQDSYYSLSLYDYYSDYSLHSEDRSDSGKDDSSDWHCYERH
jgi:hypothetical protein